MLLIRTNKGNELRMYIYCRMLWWIFYWTNGQKILFLSNIYSNIWLALISITNFLSIRFVIELMPIYIFYGKSNESPALNHSMMIYIQMICKFWMDLAEFNDHNMQIKSKTDMNTKTYNKTTQELCRHPRTTYKLILRMIHSVIISILHKRNF